MNKIQRTSRYLRWTFTALMAITPLLYIASWCFIPGMGEKDSFILGFDLIPADVVILHPLTTMMRLIGLTISLLPMTVNLLLYANLVTLFLMYERLSYFTMENVAVIRKIGFYLLLGELIRPFIEAATTALLTWQNGPGHRAIAISFKSNNVELIIAGVLIILISWIIAEGHRLNEEQQLTI
jgi:hypothetical protein